MKTIEEKARAYDKVSKEVKDFFEGKQKMYSDVNQTLEYLFPELVESEDEKIRKGLIGMLSKYKYVYHKEIAWLEKQGKQKTIDDLTPQEAMDIAVAKCFEQGEQKPIEMKTAEESLGIDSDTYNKIIDECIFGEQKSTDKVKPKFHEGDWIVENGVNRNPIQITYFEEDKGVGIKVWFNNGTGTYVDFLKGYHKWTIQDAKDGDVLYECNEKKSFIFKELKTKHIDDIASYCDIFNGIFNPNEDSWTTLDIVPATKKQRDLLFQKMEEAGYEWDTDTKELKKIEHDVQLTEFEDAIKDMMNDYRDAIGDNDATIEEIKKHAAYLLSLIHQSSA